MSPGTPKPTFRPFYSPLLRFHFVRRKVNVDSHSLEWAKYKVASYLLLQKNKTD